jgi:hypothetical protein
MASIIPGLPVSIPPDVLDLLLGIFADCNQKVAATLSRIPTTREEALDQQFIAHLSTIGPVSMPTSGWVVNVETHFLGGGHHYGKWEIADIGILLIMRRGNKVVWSKAAVLQSKRLFPDGAIYDAAREWKEFRWGFGRLHSGYTPTRSRTFEFTDESRYQSLNVGGEQAERIDAYEAEFNIPVHYLLYNPLVLPWARSIPVTPPEPALPDNDIGSRVLRSRTLLALRASGVSVPSYKEVAALSAPHALASFMAGWRLEDFVVSLLLGCHEGRLLDDSVDQPMEYLFNRRNNPIAAAFSVNLELPE